MTADQSATAPPLPQRRPGRVVQLGAQTYPLILPNIRDPRLHVAAVIITVHVLGQVGLGFWVSVPQILAAIVTTAALEIAITFRQSRALVWPASAMLTGSGVALILRVVGTQPGDHWTTDGWQLYAIVAGGSLLSKYLIRYRGSHVFNPSNVGLVVAFVALGSTRVEPLDFWWAPLTNPAMLLAYAAIAGGGLLITRRLHLLELAAAFWLTLVAGLAVLAVSSHCIVAGWSFAPVCGADYVRVISLSPEVMIFLFFMITDPKTVPAGRVGRVVFGVLVGVVSLLLMAPQTDEFGTKVGLLSGLVVLCAARPLVERFVPEPGAAGDALSTFTLAGLGRGPGATMVRTAGRVALAIVLVLSIGGGIVLAGMPARGTPVPDATELLHRLPSGVDPATLPAVVVGQDVADFDPTLAGDGMREVLVTLAQNLELENLALLRHDAAILTAVDHGDRLIEMQGRLERARAGAPVVVEHYRFDAVRVSLLVPFGRQNGLSVGIAATGTVVRETRDASGGLVAKDEQPFSQTFAVRRATGARWLNVAVVAGPPAS
jgi:hypothetical protein